MRKTAIALALLGAALFAQVPNIATPNWDSWRSLIGEWVGEGSGDPGKGIGGFSFQLDLQGRVLVRRNRADYPSAAGRLAFSHDDLMIVYQEPEQKRTHAVYFDNEGHVIRYTAEFSPDQKTLTFLGEATPGQPRFRLTYTKADAGAMKMKFEIAPPGKPEAFSTYIEAVARKK